jgi:hypothetical protein
MLRNVTKGLVNEIKPKLIIICIQHDPIYESLCIFPIDMFFYTLVYNIFILLFSSWRLELDIF